MDNSPTPSSLLGVWAHPDDEAYLSAGLMLRTARAGGRVVCATATAGELGTPDPVAWPPLRLAERRTRELCAALDAVGVHELVQFGYPDGGLSDIDDDEGAELVAELLDEVRPEVVVTFGPDGMTAHPDHCAISRWVTLAWAATGGTSTLLYATATRRFEHRFRRIHQQLDMFPAGYPVTCADDEIALEVRLGRDELDRKRAALAAHASQTESLAAAMTEPVYRHWFDIESFRLPRPAELRAVAALREGAGSR